MTNINLKKIITKIISSKKITPEEFDELIQNYKEELDKGDIAEVPKKAEKFEKLFDLAPKILDIANTLELYKEAQEGKGNDLLRKYHIESVESSNTLKDIKIKVNESKTTDSYFTGCNDVMITINEKEFIVNSKYNDMDQNPFESWPTDQHLRMFCGGKLVIDGKLSDSNHKFEWIHTFKPASWMVDWHNLFVDFIVEKNERGEKRQHENIKDNFSI